MPQQSLDWLVNRLQHCQHHRVLDGVPPQLIHLKHQCQSACMCRPFSHHLSRHFYQLSICRLPPTLPDPSTILPIASPICWIEWHSVTTLPGNVILDMSAPP